MAARIKAWLKETASRAAQQALVMIVFVTVPLLYQMVSTAAEWRKVIVADHSRQMEMDSALTLHLAESKERFDLMERRQDSAYVRVGRLEDDVAVLKKKASIINNN